MAAKQDQENIKLHVFEHVEGDHHTTKRGDDIKEEGDAKEERIDYIYAVKTAKVLAERIFDQLSATSKRTHA